jgi:hypothetical protein
MIIASDAHWRGSPPPHQRRGAGCCCLPCFWDLRWLAKRLEIGEDLRAKGLVESWGHLWFSYRPGKTDRGLKSWLRIVAHIPRKLEGGEVSLTNPLLGRLEFKAESYSVD